MWNNFLHSQIELSVGNILLKKLGSGGTPEDESPRSLTESNTPSSDLPPTTVTQEDDNPLVTHVSRRSLLM